MYKRQRVKREGKLAAWFLDPPARVFVVGLDRLTLTVVGCDEPAVVSSDVGVAALLKNAVVGLCARNEELVCVGAVARVDVAGKRLALAVRGVDPAALARVEEIRIGANLGVPAAAIVARFGDAAKPPGRRCAPSASESASTGVAEPPFLTRCPVLGFSSTTNAAASSSLPLPSSSSSSSALGGSKPQLKRKRLDQKQHVP